MGESSKATLLLQSPPWQCYWSWKKSVCSSQGKAHMERILLGTRKLCCLLTNSTGAHFIPVFVSSWSSKTPLFVVVTLHPSKWLVNMVRTAQHGSHFCPLLAQLSCAHVVLEAPPAHKSPKSQNSRWKREWQRPVLPSPFYFRQPLNQ